MLELVAGTPEWTSQVLPSKVVLDWALDIVFKLDMDLWWLFISLIEDWLRGFLGGLFGGLEPCKKFITCFHESWIYETWICSMTFVICFGSVLNVFSFKNQNLNYYLSSAVCAVCVCVCLSASVCLRLSVCVCLSASVKNFSCYTVSVNRHLEFKPEGLEG